MSGLQSFMDSGKGGSRKGTSTRSKRFTKLKKKKKTKEEVRKLEQNLLKPAPLPPYTGKDPDPKDDIEKRAVKIYFGSKKLYKLFTEHFKTTTYIENSCYEIDMLIAFLRAIKKGRLIYDKEKKRFTTAKPSNNSGKSKVGKRKRRHRSK